MRLYLVRHPPPDLPAGICYGASDVACTPQALAQGAQVVQEGLSSLPFGLAMVSSPLQRCERLAQFLCGLRPDLTYKTDPKLAEMDFGAWEMQPWAEMASEALSAWTDDFAHFRCGGSGESTAQLVQRVAACLARSLQAGCDEIWVTHAGVIRALFWLQRQNAFQSWAHGLVTARQRRTIPELPGELLDSLRAADWPQIEVPWNRVLPWDWQNLPQGLLHC
jgi:alpha-ribazole phosphatase